MTVKGFINRIRYNEFTRLYHFREEKARGRALVLIHTVLASVASNLTTGVFYTAFLTMNGINIVDAGILAFVPYIAQLFTLFSPYILEQFPKRRWVLFASRLLYHLLFVLGITLLPNVVSDPSLRLKCFVGLVLAANIINALGGQGYTVWHANFIPDGARANYFTFNSMVTNFGGCAIAVASALVADALTGSPYADAVIVALRYIGFAFAIADVLILLLPKEYPYPKSGKPKLTNLFTLPFKHKKFLLTMAVCFWRTFVAAVPAGVLDYFLINTVHVSYSYIHVINLLYSVFLLLLLPHWRKQLNKKGWVKVFSWSNLLDAPALILYAFVTPGNYLIVMSIVRLWQHYVGVGRNTAYSNFVYMNLPAEDQTNYMTFNALGTTVFTFLGMSAGTWFVSLMGESALTLFGFELTAVPLLLIIQGVLTVVTTVLTHLLTPAIMPECDRQLGL